VHEAAKQRPLYGVIVNDGSERGLHGSADTNVEIGRVYTESDAGGFGAVPFPLRQAVTSKGKTRNEYARLFVRWKCQEPFEHAAYVGVCADRSCSNTSRANSSPCRTSEESFRYA